MTEDEIKLLIESKLATGKYTLKTLIIAIVASLIVGAIVGMYISKNYFPTINTEVKQSDPIVKETVKTITDTKIQYVPKETIIYKDSAGNTVTQKESTDVQADIAQPKVDVKVNGTSYKFDLLQGENQKFENGKVTMQQTSTIGLDVKIPTIDLTRHNVLTVGAMYSDGEINPGIGYTGSISKITAYQVVGSKNAGYIGAGFKF